ncbi:MFS transporter [Rhodopila sp.]|uniref:MFS transporter n=1 Tax=Rhodopila sp. TaxID=2480087 RepID=UPI003D0E63AA
MAGPTAPLRIRRTQRNALIMLVIAGTLNYLDRSTLSIANPLIRQELGLSIGDMGLLLSAFLWAYAFAQLPGGALVDRVGPHRLLAAGLGLWSIAQAAAGFVTSFWQFSIARIFLGLGEAPMFSSAVRVVRDWYSVRDRGLPTGIWNSTSSLGPAIAPPILTVLMLAFGWRWMFAIMGLVGIAVATTWFLLYRDAKEAGFTEPETQYLTDGEEAQRGDPVTLNEWLHLFRFRTTWGLLLGFFGVVYMGWLYLAWLPGYLEMQRHMSIPRTGMVAAIPFAFGVVGSIGGGWIADRLMKQGFSPINSRKIPVIIGLLGMAAFTVVAAETSSNIVAVGAISAALMFGASASGMSWALASVAAPANCTASLGAIQNFGGYLGGALAPTVTGFIVQATGNFTPALLTSAAIGLVSTFMYLLVIPGEPISAADLGVTAAARV